MADFRRWILALAVVALLAGLTVPAGAQPVTCSTSVSVTPTVRAEGLSELVGDLVLYCTGGTPTLAGNPVPQVNITVFLNTNITSKVLGTQLVAFGNGQTSALDEALLIMDEPNSPNSPGIQCAEGGNFFNPAVNEFCPGFAGGFDPGLTGSFGATAQPYPILNCGAVVGGAQAAPDSGQSGPGVCSIFATPFSEHTYDGTIAGTPAAAGIVGDFGPCGGAPIVTVNGTIAAGSNIINYPAGAGAIPAGIKAGASVTGQGIQAGTTVVSVTPSTAQVGGSITISKVATGTGTPTLTFSPNVGGINYGCGRPNVFQGRMGALQNANQYNAVTFWGVPFDPPGTTFGRTIRITNIRANAAQLGVSSTFTTQQILMNISINGPSSITIANPQQIVAYVNRGLSVAIAPTNNNVYFAAGQSGAALYLGAGGTRTGVAPNVPVIGEFVQCVSQNGDLFSGTAAPSFRIPGYLGVDPVTGSTTLVTNGIGFAGLPGGFDCQFPQNGPNGDCIPGGSGADVTPMIRFSEGFASSWKVRNLGHIVGDSVTAGNETLGTTAAPLVTQGPNSFDCTGSYCYNGRRNNPLPIPQNVPGAVFNTESGFDYPAPTILVAGPVANPNPPPGFGFGFQMPQPGTASNVDGQAYGRPFSDDWLGTPNATGIAGAGIANQGTRLYLSFSNIPNGSSLWVSPVIYLFRQGVVHNGDPATLGPNPNNGATCNGVTQCQATGVMVLTTTDGNGNGAFLSTAGPLTPFQLQKVGASGLAVYEILATDPFSTEYADVPVVLAYASNPGQNLPAPAPPNPNTQATGGFAPFYTSAASTQPSPNATFQSPTLPVPRFVPGTAFDFINIQKCSCNILFPFVANALGYDTGIAFANTSLDPGATYGFLGVPQPGTVQFWYYGDMSNGAAVPGPQTSSVVQPGHVLTYVLSTGSTQYGLDGRAAGLTGYIIAQSQFQYCHAYAFISAQGAGPSTPGTSEGYLGIVLDRDGLPRTISLGENKAH